jgi:hypothetical protein
MDKSEELRLLGQYISQGQSLTHNIMPMALPTVPTVPPIYGRYIPQVTPSGRALTLPPNPNAVPYRSRPSDEVDRFYNPKLSELKKDDYRTYATPKQGQSWELPAKRDPNLIYRGMSHEEYQNYLKTGKIESNASMNFKGQENLTYYSNDPQSARFYSSGFAPMQHSATFDKPAYVVAVKRPGADRIRNVKGVGEDEVGVVGHIPKADVVKVYRGDVADFTPGWSNLKGSRTSPSASLVWSEVE